ncbi:hypothetical protein ANN_25256 [Periplaneta americana]|uniref:Uncharacterized protein n=1 Tax=Periplaneta americana TaxID=6978 RepID=A0ABQ8S0Y7_PERAM|nr:hypothetical protein ANN_25256 [Periplaneta americana]
MVLQTGSKPPSPLATEYRRLYRDCHTFCVDVVVQEYEPPKPGRHAAHKQRGRRLAQSSSTRDGCTSIHLAICTVPKARRKWNLDTNIASKSEAYTNLRAGNETYLTNRRQILQIVRNYNRRLRWAGHVARMGESRNAYRVLVGRPEGKRPLGMPRRRWEDNIKMDLREVGCDDRDWINLAQDRDRWRAYVRAAMNLRLFNDAVSTTRLFSVDGIGDSEMVSGEMRPKNRHRLPDIRLAVAENLGKT